MEHYKVGEVWLYALATFFLISFEFICLDKLQNTHKILIYVFVKVDSSAEFSLFTIFFGLFKERFPLSCLPNTTLHFHICCIHRQTLAKHREQ